MSGPDDRSTSESDDRSTSGPDDRSTSESRDSAPREHQESTDDRRATIRTSHEAPEVVAAALRPDNTAEMTTRVVDGLVETTIERPSTGGLRTTVDDYVVNCSVADRVVQHADRHTQSDRHTPSRQ